jgi:hypothetical protein
MSAGSTRTVVSILVIVVLAIAFWMLALAPKREKADELGQQSEQLQVALSEAQSDVAEATAAKEEFPGDYRQLVVLGQAVPAGDETSSLLVEINRLATTSHVSFDSLALVGAGEEAAPVTTAPTTPEPAPSTESSGAVPASATIPPTEAAAAVMPLGASIGTAGLGVMPYDLTFKGSFFSISDFLKKIDGLVQTNNGTKIAVDGRLLTVNGFALNPDPKLGFPNLEATLTVTTFLTPPSQGLTAGASSVETVPAVPTEAAPSEESSESSATVSAR